MQTQTIQLNEKFPQIKEIDIAVVESSTGIPQTHTYNFSKKGIPRFIKCSNRICDDDIGVSIEDILFQMVKEKMTEFTVTKHCRGFKGSPHRNCLTKFRFTIQIEYKE